MDAYLTAARETVRKFQDGENESCSVRTDGTSAKVSLKELLEYISLDPSPGSTDTTCESVLAVEAVLREQKPGVLDSADTETAISIFTWTAANTLPSEEFSGAWERSQLSRDEDSDSVETRTSTVKSNIAIALLHHLNTILPIYELDYSTRLRVITSLAAFTRQADPWTTERASNLASQLLDEFKSTVSQKDNEPLTSMLGDIAKTVIKPSFAKTKNVAITPAGRKNEHPVPAPRFDQSIFDEASKPWKFKDVYVVTVLEWIVEQYHPSDYRQIEAQFPFLVPPILSLIDDDGLAYKAKGCEILNRLLSPLSQAKSDILRRTNLDSVFQDALSPCLISLPSITPEDESIHLLQYAYPALFSVINTRFPTPSSTTSPPKPTTSKQTQDKDSSLRLDALTRVLRHHLLTSYHHTSNPRPVGSTAPPIASYPYPRLSILILANMSRLIRLLGTDVTPHLQEILPILTETLANPFGTAYLPLLQAATTAARETIANGWLRIWRWRVEMLRGLCSCWVHLEEDEADVLREQGSEGAKSLEELRRALGDAVTLLRIAVEEVAGGKGGDEEEWLKGVVAKEAGGRIDVEAEFRELVDADSRLKGMLIANED